MIRCIFISLLVSLAGAAVYQAPDPAPTPEETLILELMNRFRADPVAEADRILSLTDRYRVPDTVDLAMFAGELRALEPSPPLVFDLAALRAARRHSYYMIHNGLGHGERKGAEGYTASGFGERMRLAGFDAQPAAENAFRDARSATHSHIAFVIDWGGGGPGGMQGGRGHRRNMHNPDFDSVGPGVVTHGDRLSVTHNFGRGGGRRAGGVIYVDRNRNLAYDIGEGVGGVTLRHGEATVTSWASGAYTLPIDTGAGTVEATFEGRRYVAPLPAGEDNVKVDWQIPQGDDIARADRLLARAERASERRKTAACLDLHLAAASFGGLDPERSERIRTLTASVAEDYAAARAEVLAAIADGDEDTIDDAIDHGRDRYRGSDGADWFQAADTLARASAQVQRLEAGIAAGKTPDPQAVDRFRSALDEAIASSEHADIRTAYARLQARLPADDAP